MHCVWKLCEHLVHTSGISEAAAAQQVITSGRLHMKHVNPSDKQPFAKPHLAASLAYLVVVVAAKPVVEHQAYKSLRSVAKL